ncbi:MAG TPA: hypothetical protein VM370_13115 [Candidatus Thermoplasmatota archaeon]|nr:hypothetical protein [Candidatus Thermoplasmatota archaeon]
MHLRPLALLLALALAGCSTPDAGDPPATNGTAPTPGVAATLPPPIEDSKQVSGSADPASFVPGQAPCSTPSSQCFPYPFTLNGTATLDASVSWTVPATDFDLHVFQDGAAITTTEGASPPGPGTSEAFTLELEPGDYELVVVAWAVAQDTYTLAASFSAAGNATA